MMSDGLTLQRRHTARCPDRDKGVNFLRCRGRCPLWACGTVHGKRIRRSLKTRDLQRAARRLADLQTDQGERATLEQAADAFLAAHADRASETLRKYRRILAFLSEFCRSRDVTLVERVTIETLDGYAVWRNKSGWTWAKEIEVLRQFFTFCAERGWSRGGNPARALRRPRIIDANDVKPFTQEEIVRILHACDRIGLYPYERLRARAMVLLMRYTGMRISDVVTLDRSHIHGDYLIKRAVKNKRWIRVKLPVEVLQALERLPQPRNAPKDCTLYFASGNASVRSLVKAAERTLAAVFRRAGVEGAHAHRFRHTLASELLGKGGASVEDVASILGDSPATIRRHYAHWTRELQSRHDSLVRVIHDTSMAQAEDRISKC